MTEYYHPYPKSALVPFVEAKVGEESYVYSMADGSPIDEWRWVTELEWFEERDGEVKLKRQRWRLVAEDEITLEDPYPIEEEPEDEDG